MTDNLFTAFRRTLPEPSRIFLERTDGTTLSYGDLLDLSGRLATVIMTRASNRAGSSQTFELIWNPAGYHNNAVQRLTLTVA